MAQKEGHLTGLKKKNTARRRVLPKIVRLDSKGRLQRNKEKKSMPRSRGSRHAGCCCKWGCSGESSGLRNVPSSVTRKSNRGQARNKGETKQLRRGRERIREKGGGKGRRQPLVCPKKLANDLPPSKGQTFTHKKRAPFTAKGGGLMGEETRPQLSRRRRKCIL